MCGKKKKKKTVPIYFIQLLPHVLRAEDEWTRLSCPL